MVNFINTCYENIVINHIRRKEDMTRTFDVLGKMVVNQMNAAEKAISKNLEKLSSGNKIVSAADDAAGLGISERLNSQIKEMYKMVYL